MYISTFAVNITKWDKPPPLRKQRIVPLSLQVLRVIKALPTSINERLFPGLTLKPMEVASITGHKTLQMLKRYTHLSATELAQKLK